MSRKRKTTQMGDNPFRWECKPQFSCGWVSYTEEDIPELRKMKKSKSKYKKRRQRNIARKYRFRK